MRGGWLPEATLLGSVLALAAACGAFLTPRSSHWLLIATCAWLGGGLATLLLITRGGRRRAAVKAYALGCALNAIVLGALYLELALARHFDAAAGAFSSKLASEIQYARWQLGFHYSGVGRWVSLLLFIAAPWLGAALAAEPVQKPPWRGMFRACMLAAGAWFVVQTPDLHDQSIRCLVDIDCGSHRHRALVAALLCAWLAGLYLLRRFPQDEHSRRAITGYGVGCAISVVTVAPRFLRYLAHAYTGWFWGHGLGHDAVLAVAGYLLVPHVALAVASAIEDRSRATSDAPAALRARTLRTAAGLTALLLVRSGLELNGAAFGHGDRVNLYCRSDRDCQRGDCGGSCASAQPRCELDRIFEWDPRVRCTCEYARCNEVIDPSIPALPLELH